MCEIIRKVSPQKTSWRDEVSRARSKAQLDVEWWRVPETAWRVHSGLFFLHPALCCHAMPHKQTSAAVSTLLLKFLLSIRISLFKLIIYLIACAALSSLLLFSCFSLFSSVLCFFLLLLTSAEPRSLFGSEKQRREEMKSPRHWEQKKQLEEASEFCLKTFQY